MINTKNRSVKMTKEELKKEAEESAKQNCPMPTNWNEIDVAERAGYVKGYIAGAKPREKRIAELEKQLEELPDKWCRNKDDYCPHLAKLEQENTELKADNDARKFAMYMSEKVEKQLREENAKLKETLRTYNGCGDWDNDFHTCRVYLQHEEL